MALGFGRVPDLLPVWRVPWAVSSKNIMYNVMWFVSESLFSMSPMSKSRRYYVKCHDVINQCPAPGTYRYYSVAVFANGRLRYAFNSINLLVIMVVRYLYPEGMFLSISYKTILCWSLHDTRRGQDIIIKYYK